MPQMEGEPVPDNDVDELPPVQPRPKEMSESRVKLEEGNGRDMRLHFMFIDIIKLLYFNLFL